MKFQIVVGPAEQGGFLAHVMGVEHLASQAGKTEAEAIDGMVSRLKMSVQTGLKIVEINVDANSQYP